MQFRADGSFHRIDSHKFDAKEVDPKFEAIFKQVDEEVTAEMKQNGSFGKLGSVHQYWLLKRKKLKEQGINWRSPADLNQGTNYD